MTVLADCDSCSFVPFTSYNIEVVVASKSTLMAAAFVARQMFQNEKVTLVKEFMKLGDHEVHEYSWICLRKVTPSVVLPDHADWHVLSTQNWSRMTKRSERNNVKIGLARSSAL